MTVQEVFQAFSDPTRREIVRMLQDGDMGAGAIADRFDMTKPSISHHLGVLKSAGLVRAERAVQEAVAVRVCVCAGRSTPASSAASTPSPPGAWVARWPWAWAACRSRLRVALQSRQLPGRQPPRRASESARCCPIAASVCAA